MATGVKNLDVFKIAFQLAMDIHEISKSFPSEEKYSLTDQVRRSSRSVCANLAEAYRKRLYPAHFISKLSDADMENTETQIWLEFSVKFGFLKESTYKEMIAKSFSIGRMLDKMMHSPDKFIRNW